uniref:Uncharacterized protein n=1 Tax=Romanomermis culicivorax TaxID=13658 RepID=A0A915IR76_ROMCU
MPMYQGPYRVTGIVLPNMIMELVDDPSAREVIHTNPTKPYRKRQLDGPENRNEITNTHPVNPNIEQSDNEDLSNEDV